MEHALQVVADGVCLEQLDHQPRAQTPCNVHECPRWFVGPWSQVGLLLFFFVFLFVFLFFLSPVLTDVS